jgi:hypothetical protein
MYLGNKYMVYDHCVTKLVLCFDEDLYFPVQGLCYTRYHQLADTCKTK